MYTGVLVDKRLDYYLSSWKHGCFLCNKKYERKVYIFGKFFFEG